MVIDFVESEVPFNKTITANVLTDTGELRTFTFGKDFSRAHMVDTINRLLGEGAKRRVKRKAV